MKQLGTRVESRERSPEGRTPATVSAHAITARGTQGPNSPRTEFSPLRRRGRSSSANGLPAHRADRQQSSVLNIHYLRISSPSLILALCYELCYELLRGGKREIKGETEREFSCASSRARERPCMSAGLCGPSPSRSPSL